MHLAVMISQKFLYECPYKEPFSLIKCLCELDRLCALLDDFAPARAVWIVRDYHDGSRSAVRSFGNFVPQLRRLARDKSDAAWRGRSMNDAIRALALVRPASCRLPSGVLGFNDRERRPGFRSGVRACPLQ